jgi:tyrocidine synthetase-3
LNEKSHRLAGALIKKGVRPETIVGIMMARSIEMIVGILGILKAGGAYLPIDPDYPQERIDYMLADSNAKILLTSHEIAILSSPEAFNNRPKGSPSFGIWNLEFGISPQGGQLAYIIYTSGTTGKPKGVMIGHGNISNTVNWRKNEYRLESDDRVLQLFSFAFDGFLTSFFTPIVSGTPVILLTAKQAGDVTVVKVMIARYKITHFICTPSFYTALLEISAPNEFPGLKIVTTAGEELAPSLVAKSKKMNDRLELVNEYGPTENSVIATYYRNVTPTAAIPVGKPVANTQIYILDRHLNLVSIDVPGEVYIGGAQVARGYMNRPQLTAEKFDRDLWDLQDYRDEKQNKQKVPGKSNFTAASHDSRANTPRRMKTDINELAQHIGSPRRGVYRTGDLARWLPDGNIEFLGRIDRQVKIRGFRIELKEIETRLLHHDEIKEAAVLAKEDKNGDKYLCAYIVKTGKPLSQEASRHLDLRAYLSQKLPAYMIPSYFITMESIPLTPNGKIDVKALPAPGLKKGNHYAPPVNDTQERLVKIWAGVLSGHTGPDDNCAIGIDANFFELGGHSLKAITLISKIHKELNVRVPLHFLFENPTVRGLAGYITETGRDRYFSIGKVEKREYYPLSTAQKRLYITWYTEREGVGYNVRNLVRLEGRLSPGKLENIFKELIRRHESFRTSYEAVRDEPVQRIHDNLAFEIERIPCVSNGGAHSQYLHHFVRPFDLSRGPLIRVGLVKLAEERHLLLMDMHHIIADGYSISILVKEFTALYRGEKLPRLKCQYKDFTMRQGEILEKPGERQLVLQQETYWLKEFTGEIPVLHLPLDYTRPAVQQYQGGSVPFRLDREETGKLKDLAREEEVTLFMLYLAIFIVVLSRICDQEDILVGTPVAGRRHAEIQRVIGLFVNMLVLRNKPSGKKTFKGFLKEIKHKTLQAFENQDYPYEVLVDKVSRGESHRNSLFDVVFVWEDLEIEPDYILPGEPDKGNLKLIPCKVEKKNAPFDMILTGTETNGTTGFFINYRTSLFKKKTIEKFAGNFQEVISGILENPGVKLADIAISYSLLEAGPTGFQEDQGDFGF